MRDHEKALLLLYLMQTGMPPWAEGSQAERAEQAFAKCAELGFAEKQ